MNDFGEIKSRLEKVEDSVHSIAVTQAEQLVVLRNVVDTLQTEKKNSSDIAVLQNNWKWMKWVMGSLVLPVVFLLVRSFL